MDADSKVGERRARRALTGKGSHAEAGDVFAGLDWKAAGVKPRGVSHSVYELLGHMSYWQDWAVRWLNGEKPAAPPQAIGGGSLIVESDLAPAASQPTNGRCRCKGRTTWMQRGFGLLGGR